MIQSEGKKFDTGKNRLDLLPLKAIQEIGKCVTYGQVKYGDNNWRTGMAWSRLIGASMRHLFSWCTGETYDPESGINHLAHAATNILFLLEYQITESYTQFNDIWDQELMTDDPEKKKKS
jgi:hypothetical protein